MDTHKLIGLVTAEIIKKALEAKEDNESTTARFLLDRLTKKQVQEICLQVLAHPHLQDTVEIKIPRTFASESELPENILTDEKTTYWRNAFCSKQILLLANNEDDQGQSLRDLTCLNSRELKSHLDVWVKAASHKLPLTPEAMQHWESALNGLLQANEYTLEMFADYVSQVRMQIANEGVGIVDALGYALPILEIPRDTAYFQAIPEKNRLNPTRWQKLYQEAINKRSCLLRKHLPNQQRIEDNDLRKQFNNVHEEIPPQAIEIIEHFIAGPDDWTEASAQLALFEWETDNINALFSGLKSKKVDLASETRIFFENEDPEILTTENHLYLETLSKRKTKESRDEDKNFYNQHHLTLDKNRQLKAKWDKFVYGKPIECKDFQLGLLECIERLNAQAGGAEVKYRFIVKTQFEKGKAKWLGLNHDVVLYFCTRYRGFVALTEPYITWQTYWLFEYDTLLKEYTENKKSKKADRSTDGLSKSREATQLKFTVSLEYSVHGKKEIATIQLIWRGNHLAIGMELKEDINRLVKNPFLFTSAHREPVSKKGYLQEVSLDDVSTLQAASRQDRGSLVSSLSKAKDIEKTFKSSLNGALKDNRISEEDKRSIEQAWDNFADLYTQAIEAFASSGGIANETLLQQADTYQQLMTMLMLSASGDKNRVDLWHPLLEIGTVRILGGKPAAIVAPWHPLRLLAIAVKARQIAHVVKYIIENPGAEFGDERLFFFHLKNDISHPYYPEVAVGFLGEQPKLLGLSDTVNDYSLMELPQRDTVDQTTNENPNEAAEKVKDVIQRYLDLQPHKRSNMGIVLYNCDSKGLPTAVVTKLSSLYDDKSSNEVCCQIILRHQDSKKLNELYEKMINTVESDPDVFIASESENDFMSRLRIGIMATDADVTGQPNTKMTDIVFLQDVISRQAQIVWIATDQANANTDHPLNHFPARWSRRHPIEHGDLRSIVYLVCPNQPAVGSSYLNMLHDVVGEQPELGKHFVPARQVTFQDDKTRRIFQEVHQLGEWVVNYDDLLERRLLQHQNVTVIKYQQNRSQDRNLIISSTSSFQLLQVLVKQRLDKFGLANDINVAKLANTCIEEAKTISGDIVLRAARRGANASELIGIVLSKYLLISELSKNEPIGWFFLDDYANWLGQDEQQIADIMALVLSNKNDHPLLKIIITEAKYIEQNVSDARKTSQKQLKETVKRIQDALFKEPSRLDRDIWLARLSDLLIDGVQINNKQSTTIRQWCDMLRQGKIQIEVKGYSHVFTPLTDSTSLSEDPQIKITGTDNCYQEVFGRKQVIEILTALYRDKSAMPIREKLGDYKPWDKVVSRYPASDSLWNSSFTSDTTHTDLDSEGEDAVDSDVETPSDSIPTLPPVDEENKKWAQQICETLQRALISYGFQAKIEDSRLTPNAVLIQLKGSDKLRIEDIEKKKSVLLTTHALTLLNITARPGKIVVSIARPFRETVSLSKVWKESERILKPNDTNLCYVLGTKEIDGRTLYLNLGKPKNDIQQHAPHTLIAGTTGSGKSVLMQNLLLDICKTNSSRLAHIYLIDPKKGVDYQQLLNLPHLREGIIKEQHRAQEILAFLVEQMEYRYELLFNAGVNNLVDYNAKVSLNQRLPILWLVHDEFADWMLVPEYKEAVSSSVQRLGTKARAAGIHLIFATQRPDSNVLPVQLRDNLGNRLILRVESPGTSEIALGEKGAEKLLGKGHLAAKLGGEIIHAQVPFLSNEEQLKIVEEIRTHDTIQ